MSGKIEPREIPTRRAERFFSNGGLCDRFERRGDHLVQFHEIVNQLTDTVPALSRNAVIRRFLFSVKNHWFGRHGPRQTIERLIDLDDFSAAPRAGYSLRPSYIRVEASPQHMRSRRSVWAEWLQAQGWPVPPELGRSVLIDAGRTVVDKPALPAAKRKTGPAAQVGPRVEAEMRRLPLGELQALTQFEMSNRFDAAESTCREMRNKILAELGEDPNSA
jgi:hypothetical protein